MVDITKIKNPIKGIEISGENINSKNPGASKLLSINLSMPLPIDTAKNICGIIPIKVAKKKFTALTLKIVGNRQLICQGIPPINR